MSENLFLTGSICLDDIVAALRANHSAFTKSSKNGKTYVAIKEWLNSEPDQYGNSASIQLNSEKDAPAAEKEKKHYIGNLKIQKTGGETLTTADSSGKADAIANAASGVRVKDANGLPANAVPALPNHDDLPF